MIDELCSLYIDRGSLPLSLSAPFLLFPPMNNHFPTQAHIRPTASGHTSLLVMHLQSSKTQHQGSQAATVILHRVFNDHLR